MLRRGTPSDSGAPSLTGETWSSRRPPCQCLGFGQFLSLFHMPSPLSRCGRRAHLCFSEPSISVSTAGPHLRLWAAARVRTDGWVLRPHRKLSCGCQSLDGALLVRDRDGALLVRDRDGALLVQTCPKLGDSGGV